MCVKQTNTSHIQILHFSIQSISVEKMEKNHTQLLIEMQNNSIKIQAFGTSNFDIDFDFIKIIIM